MKNLSSYEQIDILKFLDFDQLFSVQQTNYYFNLLIEQNKWILALKELYRISIFKLKYADFSLIDNSNIAYYPITDDILVKWQSAIDKQIPLCLNNEYDPQRSIFYLSNSTKINLTLELPNHPKNIEEMQIIYFWLEQLFRCSFEETEFHHVIFNPEMINLLFENNKNIKFYLHTQIFHIDFFNSIYKYQYEFILNHLAVTDYIILNFQCTKITEERHMILLKLLLNSGKNISCVYIAEANDPLTLYNSIINHIKMSKDCSKIVPKIKFSGYCDPLKMKIKADNKIEDYNSPKIALIEHKNIFNPKIKFLAKLYFYNDVGYTIFKIKQIKQE